ncbi:macro domain-containing protein [Streptomyces sp. NPDC051183]|uniref:macro domain-containing protein n=1 Tax=Streptomyces sp. NPDC051183 TaxID=3155165 RepID=UPI0034329121
MELRAVRRVGVVGLDEAQFPLLTSVTVAQPGLAPGPVPLAVEQLLLRAVSGLDGDLYAAATLTLGLTPDLRDAPPYERRRRAAEVYRLSNERFRKKQEIEVLKQVAQQICRLAASKEPAGPAVREPEAALPPRLRQHVLHCRDQGRPLDVTLHIRSVAELTGVDVVVSPSNVHLELPPMHKGSVAAALRRAAARRDAAGDVVEDPLYDELRAWRERYGAIRRPVHPGTVAATGSGALIARGIRRIYHAAVAVPRAGTNDYGVQAQDIATAARRVLDLMAEESAGSGEEGEAGRSASGVRPLRSVCFPLIGAGRGGLPPAAAASALGAALCAHPRRDVAVHLVTRRISVAHSIAEALTGDRLRLPGGSL